MENQGEQPISFREQTAQRLAAEREAKEQAVAPEQELPEAELQMESTEEGDLVDVVDDSDNVALDEEPTDEEELEAESTSEDGAEEDSEGSEWRSKYEELEKEYRRATSHNKERDEFYATAQTEFVKMRHDFEDTLGEAKRQAEFFGGIATQQLHQLQSVNPATLPPEQQSQYYQQLNMATQQAQHMQQALERVKTQEQEHRDLMKRREADIARAAIKSRIPDWDNQVYANIGEIAQEFGYSSEEYAEMTDARFILMANEIRKVRKPGEAVKKTTQQRKTNPPRSRAAKSQQRNSKGQYIKAQEAFMKNPGEKGAFAAMKAQQLRREREGR